MKTCLPILLLAVSFAHLPAQQQPDITPETPVSTETLHQWLHSGNPRLVAWAADFAQRTQNSQILAELPALLEHAWRVPDSSHEAQQVQQRRATQAVLDALIQQHVQVPVEAIQSIAEDYPAQAVILIKRLPLSETRKTLNTWVDVESKAPGNAKLLARVAAMLLALHPDPKIVAQILQGSEEDLVILVSSPVGEAESISEDFGCRSDEGDSQILGWPVISAYYLTEDQNGIGSFEIVDVDGDQIRWYRRLDVKNGSSCHRVEPLDSWTRNRLLAHWLGVNERSMVWHAFESDSIIWTDMAEYVSRLGTIIELHTQQLQATAEALHERGLLIEGGTTASLPKLVITIKCDIHPCPILRIAGDK